MQAEPKKLVDVPLSNVERILVDKFLSSLTGKDINYYKNKPVEMKAQGLTENQINQSLLNDARFWERFDAQLAKNSHVMTMQEFYASIDPDDNTPNWRDKFNHGDVDEDDLGSTVPARRER